MADIVKDSFDETNRFSKVLFQRGRDACDFELNEFQDILRVLLFREMYGASQATLGAPALNPGSNDNGWKVVGTGAPNSVTIKAGTIFCDGIPLNNAADFTFSGFTTSVGARTDVVYLQVNEVEVADPAMIPQLGETTRRRQITVTVGVSTTGLGGVPANSASEIWEGGTHYFPIASIARGAGVPAIAAIDVTDIRKLLPPSLIAQITRQASMTVQALVGTIVETPDGTLLPKAGALSLDVDPDGTVGGVHRWRMRKDRDAVATIPLEVNDDTTSIVPYDGRLKLDQTLIETVNEAVAFRDQNMIAAGANSDPFVRMTTGTAAQGDSYLRLRDSAMAPIAGLTGTSLFRRMNSRLEIVCGDGSTSFGDFNGATALFDALTFVKNLAAASTMSVTIRVKRGAYTMAMPVDFALPTALDIAIIGEGDESAISCTTDFITFGPGANAVYKVRLEKLAISSAAATGGNFIASSATASSVFFDVDLKDLKLTDVRFKLFSIRNMLVERCTTNFPSSLDATGKAAFEFTYQHDVAFAHDFGPIVMRDCDFSAGRVTSTVSAPLIVIQYSSGPLSASRQTVEGLFVERCRIRLGESVVVGNLLPSYGAGVLVLNSLSGSSVKHLDYKTVRFKDCHVTSSSSVTGTKAPVLLHLLQSPPGLTPNLGNFGNWILPKSVEIIGGIWQIPTPSPLVPTTYETQPFTIGFTGTDKRRTNVIIRDAVIGFESYVDSTDVDIQTVALSSFNAEMGYYLNRFMVIPWVSSNGSFMALTGYDVNVENLQLIGMRQSASYADAWVSFYGNLHVKGWYQDQNYIVSSSGAAPSERVRFRNLDHTVPSTISIDDLIINARQRGVAALTSTDWGTTYLYLDWDHSANRDGCTILKNSRIVGGDKADLTTSSGVGVNLHSLFGWQNVNIDNITVRLCGDGLACNTGISIANFNMRGSTFDDCSLNGFRLGGAGGCYFYSVNVQHNRMNLNANYGALFEVIWQAQATTGSVGSNGLLFSHNWLMGNDQAGADIQAYIHNNSVAVTDFIPITAYGNVMRYYTSPVNVYDATAKFKINRDSSGAPGLGGVVPQVGCRGLETSYTAAPVTLAQRVFGNGNTMLHNDAILVTP